jgi:hypothetical protein
MSCPIDNDKESLVALSFNVLSEMFSDEISRVLYALLVFQQIIKVN